MAEIKSLTIEQIIKPKRGMKRWVLAERKSKLTVIQNHNLESSYHEVIQLVKIQYLQPNEIYYEQDLKREHEQGMLGMHSFVTPSFSWFLLCEFNFTYKVFYTFGNCPFEAVIRRKLQAYPLDRQSDERTPQCGFDIFYQTVLKVQSPHCLFTLQGKPI